MWHCRCSCENHTELNVAAYQLKHGKTKSCGCLLREVARERHILNNKFDLSNEYGIGYTSKCEEFYFDLEDYDLIKDYTWYIDSHNKYVEAKKRDGSGEHVKMHNLVMGQLYVDHIGGNNTRNDNRKSNLRCINKDEIGLSFESVNNINKQLQRNNKSGYAGVIWHKRDQIWEDYISVKGKRIYLGRYDDLDDAVKARKEAEEKYFGEYSYDNSQKYFNDNLANIVNKE